MVSADGSSQSFGGLTAQIGWFGLRVGGHLTLGLHSSNELGELSQWLCHDDSTINIVIVIIIIIIIIADVVARVSLFVIIIIKRGTKSRQTAPKECISRQKLQRKVRVMHIYDEVVYSQFARDGEHFHGHQTASSKLKEQTQKNLWLVNTIMVLLSQSVAWLIFKWHINFVFRFSPFRLKCIWCVLALRWQYYIILSLILLHVLTFHYYAPWINFVTYLVTKAGMVHSDSGWTRGVQVKLWDPLRTRAIPERLRSAFTTRRYTNPRLPLPLPLLAIAYWAVLLTVDEGFSLTNSTDGACCGSDVLRTSDSEPLVAVAMGLLPWGMQDDEAFVMSSSSSPTLSITSLSLGLHDTIITVKWMKFCWWQHGYSSPVRAMWWQQHIKMKYYHY